ncbi:MAG TPA: hypothetical protein VNX65_02715 [Patescibacteria group bacterium]|jgi:hypothetical protein|nr:hypothetical protein [Patescibacteria group bacterium]
MQLSTNIKNRLFALRGLLVVPVALLNIGMLAPTVAHAITPTCPDTIDVSKTGINGGAECAAPSGKAGTATLFGKNGLFTLIANILLFIIGAVAVIMLIIGGIRYVLSAGDQGAVTSAKNTILYAVIGIVVAFVAFAAVTFVTSQLDNGSKVVGP